ncbi:MAG: glycosyltransferase [Flavobacteriales bacterium]|nr:glycosyltransferase [Flavobacteriaceae bacterium]PHX92656.1 MAG: glycosyltransferase [Flavobacteriales bacterium]
MSSSTVEISLIVPINNEESNILGLSERIHNVFVTLRVSYELIYVNDGSTDASLAIIQSLSENNDCIKYIDFSRNFGHQIAISAGLEHAIGTRIIIMDGDGQDPPERIPDLYKKSLEGYEVVYAKRLKRKGENWLKKITASLFYRIMGNITTIDIPIDTGDFRLIHQKVQRILLKMPEQHKYLRGQIAWIGFKSSFIEYDREERMGGNTKFTYSKMIRFATDGISSFSNWPLRMATLLGFLVSGIAFMLILYSLYQKFFGYTEAGWTSLHISVLFLGGVQLLGIGILGEYLGRVSENVKNRPTYIVRDSNIDGLKEKK